MEKGPEKEELSDDPKVNPRRCSFGFMMGCMNLLIMTCGLALCVIYFTSPNNYGITAPVCQGDIKKEGQEAMVKNNPIYAIVLMLFMAFGIVAILITLFLIVIRELFCMSHKSDDNETSKIIWFVKASLLLLFVVGFVGGVLGYPDMSICSCFISFCGMLFLIFAIIKVVATIKMEEGLYLQKSELFVDREYLWY